MLNIFQGENINHVFLDALEAALKFRSRVTPSRVGDVIDIGPSYFEFSNSEHQILTLRQRGYNPFFSIIEAAWILSGKNSLFPLNTIIKDYSQYSDDGETLNGAYGFRAKSYFNIDQICQAVAELKKNPKSRRAVVTLFSPTDLINLSSNDIPCNTSFFLKLRDNNLDITVINRSNDIFLGVPYNIFVFNCIQKYIAASLEVREGVQRHFTDSLHLYTRDTLAVEKVIRQNTRSEILEWQKNKLPQYVFESIVKEHEVISNLDAASISSSKMRDLIEGYFLFKGGTITKMEFKNRLPDDIIGISAKLWLDSYKW